jgi:hypothetical protein
MDFEISNVELWEYLKEYKNNCLIPFCILPILDISLGRYVSGEKSSERVPEEYHPNENDRFSVLLVRVKNSTFCLKITMFDYNEVKGEVKKIDKELYYGSHYKFAGKDRKDTIKHFGNIDISQGNNLGYLLVYLILFSTYYNFEMDSRFVQDRMNEHYMDAVFSDLKNQYYKRKSKEKLQEFQRTNPNWYVECIRMI